VILDEGHWLTENNIKFFQQNKVDRCLLLTATLPKDKVKQDLIASLSLPFIAEITLDEAVEAGLVAPYEIKVITMELDNKEKYIKAGNKKNPFMSTEQNQYQYLTKRIYDPELPKSFYQAMIYKRMNFIYNLKSKTEAAKWLLEHVIPKEDRTLIFAGSIEQAEWLNKDYFHSKSDDKALIRFTNKDINRLSCVNALNEGMNLNDVDTGLIVQLNSKSLKLTQRMGRMLRFRKGHRGIMYILSVKGTVDEEWTRKALEDFDSENIQFYELKELKNERKS
jgi:superfamily II DNA or RNA helicase